MILDNSSNNRSSDKGLAVRNDHTPCKISFIMNSTCNINLTIKFTR